MTMRYRRPLVFVGTRLDMEPLIEIAELNQIPILGILDRHYVGQKFEGLDVIGSDLDLLDANNQDMQKLKEQADFFVATFFGGNTNIENLNENTFHLRLERIDIVKQAGCNLINLIHPGATVSKTAKLGRNSLVMNHAYIESHCDIGSFCTFMYNNGIAHHAVIGDNCAFMPGTTGCAGLVKFGNNVLVGIESHVMSSGSSTTVVGNNVIIGPKMLILKDIPDNSVVQVNGKIIENTAFNADLYNGIGVVPSYVRIH
jgi:acyl-[acyl carrier protein]--UDP-N-acetylglucosamine O-acyltransferase